MALPNNFSSSEEYFEAVTVFFQEYQYLFNFANTDILVCNALDRICIDNVGDIEVPEDFDYQENDYLKSLMEKIKKFEVHYEYLECEESIARFEAPLSPKKQHEIVYLANEIKQVCGLVGCETVVDFGSGLGYLDQQLFDITNFKILGLECNENFYVEAKKRQRKYHIESLDHVKYIKHTVNADSNVSIQRYINEKFSSGNTFCITGLHACADLTIDAVDLFMKMEDCKAIVLMSCCYHKMNYIGETFKNFPASKCCKRVCDRKQCREFMRIPFMRLAAQPPDSKTDVRSSVFNLLARGVLQLYAHRHGCKLKRKKRKAVRMKTMLNNFGSYLEDAHTNGFTITKLNENDHSAAIFDLGEIRKIWRELNDDSFKKAALFVLLQNKLQPIIENFILYDRLCYLKENGVSNCRYKQIFNNIVSPRCLALIACK